MESPTTTAPQVRARVWMLTVNNPTQPTHQIFGLENCEWVAQLERGEKEGTLHYQAVIRFKNARGFNSVKNLFPEAHIEKARNAWPICTKYCTKLETRVAGPWASNPDLLPKKVFSWTPKKKVMEWLPWQTELLARLEEEPDPRKIMFYYDEVGGKGKTAFCNYMQDTYEGVLCVNGNVRDIMNMISNQVKNDPQWKPMAIFIDAGREQGLNISWRSIEEIKNGRIINTKYEAGSLLFGIPHVVVFSNFKPDVCDMIKLSADRWDVTEL